MDRDRERWRQGEVETGKLSRMRSAHLAIG